MSIIQDGARERWQRRIKARREGVEPAYHTAGEPLEEVWKSKI